MFDIDHLAADCHAALTKPSPQMVIRELVARAVTRAGEVERALGTPRRGGFFPLHQSPGLTILNVVWTPGMAIYPHDHRMWAVIGLYGGCEDNTFYRRSPQGLVAAGAKQLVGTETVLLGEAVIHAVANPPARIHRGHSHLRRRLLRRAAQRVGARLARGASLRRGAGPAGIRGRERTLGPRRGGHPMSTRPMSIRWLRHVSPLLVAIVLVIGMGAAGAAADEVLAWRHGR